MNAPAATPSLWPTVFGLVVLEACVLLSAGGCRSSDAAADQGLRHYRHAVEASEKGDTARAVTDLQAALAADPQLTAAHVMLGDLYRAAGELAQAADEYQAAVQGDPNSAGTQYKLAVTWHLLGRLDEAAQAYRRTIELDSRHIDAAASLSIVELTLGDKDEALRWAEQAVIMDPQSAAAVANLGVVLDARGELTRALAAYRQSLAIQPDQPAVLHNMVRNLLDQGRAGEAVAVAEQAARVSDTPAAHKLCGDTFVAAEQPDKAIQQYDLALALDPRFRPALNAIGFTRIKQYRRSMRLDESMRRDALSAWQRSLDVEPNQPRIRQAVDEWSDPPPPQ
jgi:tetratricopeptide (TPR) repeat protein